MFSVNFGTKIHMGEDSLKRLEQFDKERIYIITDEFISKSEILSKVMALISSSNELLVFKDVIPDPPIDTIVAGIELAKDFRPTQVIAIGGGSAIDAAKGIIYFGQQSNNLMDASLICIPTTSGTGSEVTNFAIITDAENGTKYPLVTDDILPKEAILDTSLVINLPQSQTANTGIDVLTHAIEAMVSTKASDISDAFAEKAIKLVFDYLPRAYKDGTDKVAREKMHIASTLAGLAFNQASLGLNHGIAHAAGAKFHIAHGRLNGILLPYVIKFNSGISNSINQEVAEKYRYIASILDLNTASATIGTRSLVNEINKLLTTLGIPHSFSEYGLDKKLFDDNLSEIADSAVKDMTTKTNPIPVTPKDVARILIEAY
ncbi:1-propanol dehydrogenase PduQ [Fundicoccus culcitae]|uniref:Iron-containing alcohol dehydrogenase n=1 Tax=Fundicoccus culcitae TaxID=2969821 RepID=A0ABY5P3P5_9LACT|nr:1-propanol dehydrogenase PduQ [Fundicoccus culcitae]UUX33321.1 iron-containing alcohol dehydrogenase [Fundicoccus culcitae]